jgi:hypothetical protein
MSNDIYDSKKMDAFAALLHKQQVERLKIEAPSIPDPEEYCKVTVKRGKKYTKVDVGTSGKFMVDQEGNIFGIKGYGVIHRGHKYGTLDTIDQYYWGHYSPHKIV